MITAIKLDFCKNGHFVEIQISKIEDNNITSPSKQLYDDSYDAWQKGLNFKYNKAQCYYK